MIRSAFILAAASLLTRSLFAAGHPTISEEGNALRPYQLKEEANLLRANLTFTPDISPKDSVGIGFEIAVGRAIKPLDILGAFVSHVEADPANLTIVGLFAEESYLTDLPVFPYVAASVGYGFVEDKEQQEQESPVAEIEIGAKVRLNDRATFHAGAELQWSDEEIFPSDDVLENKQWRFVTGLTYYY